MLPKQFIIHTILTILGTVFILFGRLYSTDPAIYTLLISLLTASIVGWLWTVQKRGLAITNTPVNSGLILFTIAMIISSLFAVDPSRSWRMMYGWSGALLTFIMLVCLVRTFLDGSQLLRALLNLTSLIMVFAILEVITLWSSYQQYIALTNQWISAYRPHGGTGSANTLGIILVLGIVLMLHHLIESPRSWGAYLWLIFGFIILLPTKSSGALLALVIGCGSVGCFYLPWDTIKKHINPYQLKTQIIGAIGLLIGAISAIIIVRQLIQNDPSASARIKIWQAAIQTWQGSPFFGVGLDHFSTFYTIYKEAVPDAIVHTSTHNLALQILAEMGMFGLMAAIVFLLQFVHMLWRARPIQNWSTTTRAAITGLVPLCVHALVDTPEIWIMGIGSALLAIVVTTLPFTTSRKRQHIISYTTILWPILGLSLIIFGFKNTQVRQTYQKGIQATEEGNWDIASTHFDKALAQSWILDSGLLYASAFTHGVLSQDSAHHRQLAIAQYEDLIKLEPAWPSNYVNLGKLYELNDQPDRAFDLYQKALEHAPNQVIPILNVALLSEKTDSIPDTQKQQFFYQVYLSDFAWHTAPLWETNEHPYQAIQQAKLNECQVNGRIYPQCETAPESDPRYAMITVLAQNELDKTLEIIDQLPPSYPVFHSKYILEQSGIDPQSAGKHLIPSIIASLFYPLWLDLETLEPADVDKTLDYIDENTTYGPLGKGSQLYSSTFFKRTSLPIDLLPYVSCFAMNDSIAWQLMQLEQWYQANNRPDLAQIVSGYLNPADQGVRPCTTP